MLPDSETAPRDVLCAPCFKAPFPCRGTQGHRELELSPTPLAVPLSPCITFPLVSFCMATTLAFAALLCVQSSLPVTCVWFLP